MRFLIIFLLLSYLHIPIVFTIENGSVTGVQKSVKKAGLVIDKAVIFSKKENHSLSREPFTTYLDRIHQTPNHHHVITLLGFVICATSHFYIPIKAVKIFRTRINYSYQFIFNCLYPKHTFW